MANRSKSRGQGPPDPNELAFRIAQQATGQTPKEQPAEVEESPRVTIGRVGGLKGGPARKAALTPEQRTEIAKKAAKGRWGKRG